MALNTDALKASKGKGFESDATKQKPQDKSGSKQDSSLTAHQQFEDVARGLAAQSDNNLNALLGAVVSNRKQAVSRAADVLQAVQTGQLDLHLLAAEFDSRGVEPVDVPVFEIPSDALDIPAYQRNLDAINRLAGITAHAIAGA